jgi:23S rRNA (pseudouridine1915-N3)-methyltransferase
MKLQFWSVGKPHEGYVIEGIALFTKRINHYYKAEWKIITPLKNAGILAPQELKIKEGENILSILQKEDYLILLDENGKNFTSEGLAKFIETKANESEKNIVFLIGGAFGVSPAIKARANYIWSLSSLVFPHQLVRLLLTEQIYRACSIIKNEKYHHQ